MACCGVTKATEAFTTPRSWSLFLFFPQKVDCGSLHHYGIQSLWIGCRRSTGLDTTGAEYSGNELECTKQPFMMSLQAACFSVWSVEVPSQTVVNVDSIVLTCQCGQWVNI